MRTTIALDDELVAKAQDFTGLTEKSALIREALKALIERESARRLARLGGSEPHLRRLRDGERPQSRISLYNPIRRRTSAGVQPSARNARSAVEATLFASFSPFSSRTRP